VTTRIRTPAGSRIDRGAHASPHGGTVSGAPRVWLRLEAGALLIAALVAFAGTRQPWWLVPTVVLLPDPAWVGYAGGTRSGPPPTTPRTPLPCPPS
jgi:hypothetical protein